MSAPETSRIDCLGHPAPAEGEARGSATGDVRAKYREPASEMTRLMDALELAWGIIANAGGGDWTREAPEWQETAARWRDEHWHPALDRHRSPVCDSFVPGEKLSRFCATCGYGLSFHASAMGASHGA